MFFSIVYQFNPNGFDTPYFQIIPMFVENTVFNINYTPTAIMLARYVTHMNTQFPGGICYSSLEVGWYSIYQPTSTKA